MTFGQKLKDLRKEKKLTQEQLGKKVGVSDRTIGYYETDERFPPKDVLENIANYFNLTIDYLVGRVEEKTLRQELEELKSITGKELNLTEADKQTILALVEAQLKIVKNSKDWVNGTIFVMNGKL